MRRPVLILSAGVLAAVIAACGGSADSNSSAASTDSTPVAAPAPAPASMDSTAPASTAALPAGVTADMVAAGQKFFTAGAPCLACHGADAKGTAMAPDLTDNTWLNIDGSYEAIKGLIKTGVPKPKDPTHVSPMPPMGGAQLTDEQISDLAAYIYSLGHKG